jgi:predicted kinase
VFVLVTGPPAAGKTTVSRLLARELDLPRLAKDTIKRGLLDVLGTGDLDGTRRVGAAAVSALLAVAAENDGAVLDSVWVSPDSVARLNALPAPVVEVFCQCELDELRRRYRQRAQQRQGRGYDFDLERPESELWNEHSLRPLAGGWPVVTVDTSVRVDVRAVAEAVRVACGLGAPAQE